jgi:hypothetical protein
MWHPGIRDAPIASAPLWGRHVCDGPRVRCSSGKSNLNRCALPEERLSVTRIDNSSSPCRSTAGCAVKSLAGIVLVTIGFLLSTATGAQAAQPPQFRELEQEVIHPTRVLVETLVETFGATGEWAAGYSTEEEPTEWIPAGEGLVVPGEGTAHISVGALDATSSGGGRCHVLHKLAPKTQYYVHFTMKTAGGNAERTYRLTRPTDPIGKPEIPSVCLGIGGSTFKAQHGTRTTEAYTAQIETNGAPTEYHFEYALSETGPWQPFTSKGEGIVTAAEDFANPEAEVAGLAPETSYFVRLRVSHKKEIINGETVEAAEIEEKSSFTTPTARPVAEAAQFRNIKANSAIAYAQLDPSGSETHWRLESASSPIGPWTPIAGLQGTVTQAEAEALPERNDVYVEGLFPRLTSATKYCVRLFAENAAGEGRNGAKEPILSETQGINCFETAGPPSPTTLAVHALDGESLRLLGSVSPNSIPAQEEQTIAFGGSPTSGSFTLTFAGDTTGSIAFNASAEEVRTKLISLPNDPQVAVYGTRGGPYTVVFSGTDAAVDEPQITGDGSGLVPVQSVEAGTLQNGGESYDLRYYFEYVTQQKFVESGFNGAEKTASTELASGKALSFVGENVTGLQGGETYRYRLAVASSFPGTPLVQGPVESLVVPTPVALSEAAPCANAAVRTGPSANLPDCRAYEQVTPVDKEGAQEPFNYGPTAASGVVVAGNGEKVALQDPAVSWGPGPEAGQSPYFFSREESQRVWQMVAGSPQPATGVERIVPELFSSDLSQFAAEDDVHTSLGSGESKEVKFEVGPAGGPYTTVANVPRKQLGGGAGFYEGWVAASDDFSKLILQVEDHNLVTPRTNTKEGNDLYAYDEGKLTQVNIGAGSCGAHVVSGEEVAGVRSSSHALSSDGSSVFFEAAPGNDCSASMHLYVRRNESETRDLGEYRFGGAASDGSKVLLEKENAGSVEYSLYEMETSKRTTIFTVASSVSREESSVSQDFSAIYFHLPNDDAYRYDVASEALTYLFRYEGDMGRAGENGRFYYFQGSVAGVKGVGQMFLYDDEQSVVQCVSCTPYDPEPKLGSYFPHHVFGDLGPLQPTDGHPNQTFLSADGSYAFFDTPSALVSQDVDGEIAPNHEGGAEFQSQEFSLSSDVYEWRREGIDGCAQIEGCVALITNGRGGFLNLLIGATPSGRDVFVYTASQLVGQDNDKAGDLYDVRIGGGFAPPPPPPVECEGDACSTPLSPPNDATPASSVFNGTGNVPTPSKGKAKSKSKKHKVKKHKAKSKKRKKRGKKVRKPTSSKSARRQQALGGGAR